MGKELNGEFMLHRREERILPEPSTRRTNVQDTEGLRITRVLHPKYGGRSISSTLDQFYE